MSKIVHMPVPVRAEHKPRGMRGTETSWVRVDVPLQVAGVSASEAPVAVVARPAQGAEVIYRSSGGALWRPLLTGPYSTRPVVADLAGVAAMAVDAEFTKACDQSTWNDNPFGNALAARFDKSNLYVPRLPPLAELYRLMEHNSRAVAEEAVRVAARDLLEIDGVVHKRTVAPCWGVGVHANFPYHGGHLGIVLPDLPGDEVTVFVPPDRKDDLDELQAMVDEVSRKEALARDWRYQPLPDDRRGPPGDIEILGDLPDADYGLMTMAAFRDRVVETFSEIKFGDVPLAVGGFAIDLRRAVAAREAGRPDAPDDTAILAGAVPAREAMTELLWHWHRLSPPLMEAGFHLERVARQVRLDAEAAEVLAALSLTSFR